MPFHFPTVSKQEEEHQTWVKPAFEIEGPSASSPRVRRAKHRQYLMNKREAEEGFVMRIRQRPQEKTMLPQVYREMRRLEVLQGGSEGVGMEGTRQRSKVELRSFRGWDRAKDKGGKGGEGAFTWDGMGDNQTAGWSTSQEWQGPAQSGPAVAPQQWPAAGQQPPGPAPQQWQAAGQQPPGPASQQRQAARQQPPGPAPQQWQAAPQQWQAAPQQWQAAPQQWQAAPQQWQAAGQQPPGPAPQQWQAAPQQWQAAPQQPPGPAPQQWQAAGPAQWAGEAAAGNWQQGWQGSEQAWGPANGARGPQDWVAGDGEGQKDVLGTKWVLTADGRWVREAAAPRAAGAGRWTGGSGPAATGDGWWAPGPDTQSRAPGPVRGRAYADVFAPPKFNGGKGRPEAPPPRPVRDLGAPGEGEVGPASGTGLYCTCPCHQVQRAPHARPGGSAGVPMAPVARPHAQPRLVHQSGSGCVVS